MIKAVLFDCYGVVLDVYTNQQQQAVVSYIRSLKGKYRLGLVSNVIHRASIERHFTTGELDTLFDTVVASGEVGYEKPEPEIYQLAADQLGVSPDECLFVDDIERFCLAATKLGMNAVVFLNIQDGLEAVRQKLAQQ